MSNFASYRHKSYDGGLNNTDSRRDIDRDEASNLYNWDITYKGRLQSRKGLTQVGSTLSNAPKSAGVYQKTTGTKYLVINEGTDIRYLNGSTFTDIGNLTANERLSYANVKVEDKIYLSSENNGLISWDGGAAVAAVGSSISGNVIMWYQNHLFHINNVNVGGTKYSDRIYWSDFGDPEAYTTATSFVNLPGEGRAITMNVLGDRLVIFKESSYMFLEGYGASSWAISASATSIANMDSSVGCVAPKGTVRVSANELWFIDNQGFIRRITQSDYGYSSKVMSNKIDGTRLGLNLGNISLSVAWYDDDKIYFAVPSSGSSVNDTVLVFDRKASTRNGGDEAWTVYTGWTINDLITFGSTPTLYILGSTSKKVYSHTGENDDSVAISCRWDGKNDDYDQSERYKKYAYGYIYSQAQNDETVTIHASVDGAAFSEIDSFSLDTTGTPLGPTGSATMGPTGSFILGGSGDIEEKYYFYDGGGEITGKTLIMSIRATVTEQVYVDTFTNHFTIRSLK